MAVFTGRKVEREVFSREKMIFYLECVLSEVIMRYISEHIHLLQSGFRSSGDIYIRMAIRA